MTLGRTGCTGCKGLPGPPQVRNIIANELAERFCYYGTRSILTLYLTDQLGFTESKAIALISYWVGCTYLSPLLGGYLADALWGRYKTIMRFNVAYLLGVLALSASAFNGIPADFAHAGLYIGLALIALGTGGIKSNIAPFGADQISDPGEKTSYFFVFYQSINVGSFLAYVSVPVVREAAGAGAALSLPAAMLVASQLAFFAARKAYVHEPVRGSVLTTAWRVFRAALRPGLYPIDNVTTPSVGSAVPQRDRESIPLITAAQGTMQTNNKHSQLENDTRVGSKALDSAGALAWPTAALSGTWLDKGRGRVSDGDILDVAAALRLLPVFALLPFFWLVYESYPAVWTLQARRMNLCLGPNICLQPENVQTLNALLVVLLIPLFDQFIIPGLNALPYSWLHLTPLRRMSAGMFMAGFAWVCTGVLQSALLSAPIGSVSVAWQLPQYIIITAAEICVSTTGLEFSYREAPESMKGMIMALWFTSSAVGNLLNGVLYDALVGTVSQLTLVWLSTGLVFCAAVAFVAVAARYGKGKPGSVKSLPAVEEREVAAGDVDRLVEREVADLQQGKGKQHSIELKQFDSQVV